MTAVKFVPFFGWVTALTVAYAVTYSIGEVSDHYFKTGRGVSPDALRDMFEKIYKSSDRALATGLALVDHETCRFREFVTTHLARLIAALAEGEVGYHAWLGAQTAGSPDPITKAWVASDDPDAMTELIGWLECGGSFAWRDDLPGGASPQDDGPYWRARLACYEADTAIIGSADKRRAMADGIRAVVQEPTTSDVIAAFAKKDK